MEAPSRRRVPRWMDYAKSSPARSDATPTKRFDVTRRDAPVLRIFPHSAYPRPLHYLLTGDFVQDGEQILAKLTGVFAHREVAVVPHFSELRPFDVLD
jgi:hypothetical protein